MKLYNKLFLSLSLGFIIFIPLATILHEIGHYFTAKWTGNGALMGYDYTYWYPPARPSNDSFLYKQTAEEAFASVDFPYKNTIDPYEKKRQQNDLLIGVAGPAQNILVGTLGFLLTLLYRRKMNSGAKITTWQWITIFSSMLWLRQIRALFVFLYDMIVNGKQTLIGDEEKIAYYLGLPIWSLTLITGLLGLIVFYWVSFKIIPPNRRLTFILSLFLGCAIGYYNWFDLLGPSIMP